MAKDLETYAVIGAAMEVHKQLGHGFLEPVYQEALAIEFDLQKIPSQREASLGIAYKNHPLACAYKADFICFKSIVVELKALPKLSSTEESQLLNYLKATHCYRGLLLNFGSPSLEYKRMVFGNLQKSV